MFLLNFMSCDSPASPRRAPSSRIPALARQRTQHFGRADQSMGDQPAVGVPIAFGRQRIERRRNRGQLDPRTRGQLA